jgi:hypothetical protein
LTRETTDHHIDRRWVLHRANIIEELDVWPMSAKDLLLPRVELALPLDVESCPLKAKISTTNTGERRTDGEWLRHDAFSEVLRNSA